MRTIRPKTWILLTAALLVAGTLQAAQAPHQNGTGQDQQKPEKSSDKLSKKKAPIAGAARVSTDAALKDATEQAAKKPATEEAKEHPAGEDVLELHPAESESANSTSVKAESQGSKKAKDVHGTVYGATDARNVATHRTGGAVGATSKSGKSSVYVETEGARTTPPR
jgi:hypothetical protein